MGDDERRAIFEQRIDRFLHKLFSARVDIGCGFIKHKQTRIECVGQRVKQAD